MKKSIKILLIIVLVAIGIYALRIAYGFFIWYNVSSEDQLKLAEALYKDCKERNRSDCEADLARDLLDVFSTQRKELMEKVWDEDRTEAERIEDLKTFYELSRLKNKDIDKEEALFYYIVAYHKDSPIDLAHVGLEYLLEAPVDEPRVVEVLMMIAGDPEMPPEWRKQAINSLGKAGVKEAADIFIDVLRDEGSAPRYTASTALIEIGAVDKIPELLVIALDEEMAVPNRVITINTIKDIIVQYGLENKEEVVTSLKTLLEHEDFTLRITVADALETLTGEEYYDENREMTEEEVEEYVGNKYLENILVPGIDY